MLPDEIRRPDPRVLSHEHVLTQICRCRELIDDQLVGRIVVEIVVIVRHFQLHPPTPPFTESDPDRWEEDWSPGTDGTSRQTKIDPRR